MKPIIIFSLLMFTSMFMAGGLGVNQAFGDDGSTQKTCGDEFSRNWISSSIVPQHILTDDDYTTSQDKSSLWLCLTPNGINDSYDEETEMLLESDIGTYVARALEKSCDIENGYSRHFIDSQLVPLSFRDYSSSQWICLNTNGQSSAFGGESIQLSDIGNYIIRNIHKDNQHTEGFDDVGNVIPEPELNIDWENKYYDVLSKFNNVSIKVGELQEENEFLKSTQSGELQVENDDLKAQISVLRDKINNLDAIVMEQLNVIYKWVVG